MRTKFNLAAMLKITGTLAFFLILALMPAQVFATDHSYYNGLRSYGRHLYFSSSAAILSGKMMHEDVETSWRGYGVETGVGTQLFRFFHLELSHTMCSMTATQSDAHHLSGSKINGKMKMSFRSPIGNLELGVGGHVGSYGYIREGQATDLSSAGHSVGIGLNYFTSEQLSVHGTISQSDERWTKTRGAEFKGVAETDVTGVAVGISLWR